MRSKFSALSVVLAVLVLGSFSFIGVTASGTEYDPMSDVDKDLDVDIFDVVRLAGVYGSDFVLPSQPNRTTVTVLSYEEGGIIYENNSLVALFPQLVAMEGVWKYTNATGTVAFDLNPNENYVAMAWSEDRSSYNYVNLTTNSQGEADVVIWLNHWSPPSTQSYPIRTFPKGWVIISVFDNNTGKPYTYAAEQGQQVMLYFLNFTADPYVDRSFSYGSQPYAALIESGILAIDSKKTLHTNGAFYPLSDVAVSICDVSFSPEFSVANCTYRTDEFGGAHTTATIYRYW
jgi:hypothetical protein